MSWLISVLTFCTTILLSLNLSGCAPAIDGQRLANRAQALLAENQVAQASDLASRALATTGLGDDFAVQRAPVLVALGQCRVAQQKYTQAEALFFEALSTYQRRYGLDSQETMEPLDGLRRVYQMQRQYKQAEKAARQILSIQSKQPLPNDRAVDQAISNVLAVACVDGHCADETALYERLLALRLRRYGPDHAWTVAARLLLAESYTHKKQYDAANKLLRQNVDSCLHASASDEVIALNNLARALETSGDWPGAMKTVQQAEAIEADATNGRHLKASSVLGTLRLKARLLSALGQTPAAQVAWRQVVDRSTALYGAGNPYIADDLIGYADALRKAGKKKEAAVVQAQAEHLYGQR